jgi:D-beta-D-heptose 7-phosphate kinase/D-beta-D-heptose 1-phosphate adenosyltransferase
MGIAGTTSRVPASKWYGCTIFKPNYKEAILMTGTKDWKKQCDILMKETNCKVCIITNEGKGVYYKTYDEYGEYVPKNTINVQSVVGAGDCFISFISICQSLNLSIKESIEIAFFASSIYVQKLNGYAIDLNDLKKHHDNCNAKIVNSDFEFNSNDLVFTNGCFDAGLTPAHIECLKFAKKQGEKLVVALNSDNSVKRLKGEKRPIYSLEDRMKIVSSLEFVDYVTWFEEDTPLEIIKKIKPKKIVKGGDYHPEDVVGKEYAEVIIFNFQECVSTTEKLKQLNLI